MKKKQIDRPRNVGITLNDRNAYLDEYTSNNAVKKYSTGTAGKGIQYNLAHIYGPLYDATIDAILLENVTKKPFRILEYDCGAGMNLLHMFNLLIAKKIPIELAIGTDFSNPLIEAAKRERSLTIANEHHSKIKFILASNE